MSISSVSASSGNSWSIREAFQKMRSNGGISKDDLNQLASKLDNSEVKSGINSVVSSFDSIDSDGNGMLDGSEMAAYNKKNGVQGARRGPPPGEAPDMTKEQLSQMADETGDSSLAKAAESFDEADSNKDGKVSQSEYFAFLKANGLESNGPTEAEGQDAPPEMSKDEIQKLADKKSAAGEADDLLSKLVSSFDDADTDSNGTISQDEFKAFAESQGIKPRHGHGQHSSSTGNATESATSETENSKSTSSSTTSAALQAMLKAYLSNGYATDATSWFLREVSA